ncbi:MAG: glycosyltransferase family 2 protein, partial [Paracoccus sp. (in: a-proteobacteria)]|nr:glycosyltransferase family 2 protein [Paracoccus sp. (in: a-proteobacteria)]
KKWFDLCFETSNRDEAARVFQLPNFSEKKFPYARADLLHPDYCAKSSQEEWLTVLSGIFTDNGLEPVSLLPPQAGLPLFDRLTAHANGIVKSGPLVSIVVSIWEPDEGLVTAIRSLLAQTWANIEILMVDDACAKEFRPLIERVAKMDPRIRLIRQETNMGTYMARNRAMQEARGEFITFHDADDWCHPRRIERQIQPMLENEHIMSTTSQTIRARENLLFSDLGSMTSIRLNSSSLMFRLDAVREKIGYFHASRKAADSEYIFRIQAAYGAGCRENVMDILSIIRIGTESLSGQDFWEGWRHPMRHQYRQSYEHWHSKIKGGNESGQLDVTDIGPISVPRRYCIGFSDQTVKQYKVVFVADWSGEDVACDHMSEELAARATEKQSIAVLNMASPRWLSFHARDKQRAIQSMINDKLIDEVSTMETLKARTVVITDPAIVQYCSTERSQWLVERVYVLNRADTTGVGTEALYDFRTVVDNIRKICGVKPEWIENIAQIGS